MRTLFKCKKCNTIIKAYKSKTSTRRKCANCGSYDMQKIKRISKEKISRKKDKRGKKVTVKANIIINKIKKKAIKVPLVSIVIINYNGQRYLKACFDSLKKQTYENFEIIMIDNASDDDSVRFTRKNYPNVKIIENSQNNYCQANNLGIKTGKGEFIALLNNDTILDKNWLKELMTVIVKDKKIAGVGSKILFEKNKKIQSTGHQEYPNFYWGDRGFEEEDKGQYNKVEEVDSLCGVSVLFRKKYLEEVGMLDEDFVMYCEEIDLAIRLKKKGWKLVYVPKSITYHKYQGTNYILSPENPSVIEKNYVERNRLLLIAKHFPEKIPEAMSSSAFFYIEKKYDLIYDSLNLIIAKLIELHPKKVVNSVMPQIFLQLKKIVNFEKNASNISSQLRQELAKTEKKLDQKSLEVEKEGKENKEKITKQETELKIAKEQNNVLTEQNRELRTQLTILQGMEKKFNDTKSQNEVLREQVRIKQEGMEKEVNKNLMLEEKIKAINEKNDDLKLQILDLQKTIRELKERIQKKDTAFDDSTNEIRQIEREKAKTEKEYEKILERVKQKDEQIKEIKSQSALDKESHKKELKLLNEEIIQNEKDLAKQETEILNLKKEQKKQNTQQTQEITHLKKEIEKYLQEIKELTETQNKLKQEATDKDKINTQLSNQLKEKNQLHVATESEKEQMIESKNRKIAETTESHNQEVAELTVKHEKLKQAIEQIKKEIAEVSDSKAGKFLALNVLPKKSILREWLNRNT